MRDVYKKAIAAVKKIMAPEPVKTKPPTVLQHAVDDNMVNLVETYYTLEDDDERSFIDECRKKTASGIPLTINQRNQLKEIVDRGY